MGTNLEGDRYDTIAAEIMDGVDLAPLRGHQRQNLNDAIAARLRYEIEGHQTEVVSVTESVLRDQLAAQRQRVDKAEAACAELREQIEFCSGPCVAPDDAGYTLLERMERYRQAYKEAWSLMWPLRAYVNDRGRFRLGWTEEETSSLRSRIESWFEKVADPIERDEALAKENDHEPL